MSVEEKYEKELKEISPLKISGSGKAYLPGLGYVTISGSGFISNEEIRVSGSGVFPGGLQVKRVACSGSVSVMGEIEAEEAHFSGSALITGEVKAKLLSASGSFSSQGLCGEIVKLSGSAEIKGNAKLDNSLKASGSLNILGDLIAEENVDLHGSFEIQGKVSAKIFRAFLCRRESYVKNGINANFVDVRGKETEGIVIFGFTVFGRRFRTVRLNTSDVIGEVIHLENVVANNIVGKRVSIGEGCIIKGKIQYSESISLHENAKISKPPEKSGAAAYEK